MRSYVNTVMKSTADSLLFKVKAIPYFLKKESLFWRYLKAKVINKQLTINSIG